MDPRFLPAGDTALVVEFGDEIDRAMSERVLRLAEQVRNAAIAGVIETVPTFRSLMVHYDPLVTTRALARPFTYEVTDEVEQGAVVEVRIAWRLRPQRIDVGAAMAVQADALRQ